MDAVERALEVGVDHGLPLLQAFSAGIAAAKASAHLNAQQVIELDGDAATDTHYRRGAIVSEHDGTDLITENSIRYVDTLQR